MLRSLNRPIDLHGATCSINIGTLSLTGKHGSSEYKFPEYIDCKVENSSIVLQIKSELSKKQRAMAGSFKAGLISLIKGLQFKHERVVIFTGTGCSVKVAAGDTTKAKLNMRVGKSHPVEKEIPDHITCVVESSDIRETKLKVSGVDAAAVGQFASELCIHNPYKGGIHAWIEGNEIPVKEGKSG